MQGVITDVGLMESVILGDNGSQYKFSPWAWRYDDISPEVGMRVGFESQHSYAVGVFPLSEGRRPARSHPVLETENGNQSAVGPGMPHSKQGMRWWGWVLTAVGSILVLGIVTELSSVFDSSQNDTPSAPVPYWAHTQEEILRFDKATEYSAIYAEQIAQGSSDTYAEEYAKSIVAGFSTNYAREYAKLVAIDKTPLFARTYASQASSEQSLHLESERLAYAEQMDTGHTHWYAYQYAKLIGAGKSETYARAFVELLESSHLPKYAAHYAELVDASISPSFAHTYAEARFIYQRTEESARRAAEKVAPLSLLAPLDVAVALTMHSTTDGAEVERRATSAREFVASVERADVDADKALELLNDLAPEASIAKRQKAADKLADIFRYSSGELTPQQSMQAANALAEVVVGHGINSERRSEAARDLVRLSHSGGLNVENSTELMNAIAPELSIEARKEALGYLAWQFSRGEWDSDNFERTEEEGYKLISGGELQAEKRIGAGVELVGEGLKRFDGSSYDDESIDQSVAMLKGAISGTLTTASAATILGLDTGEEPDHTENEEYRQAYRDAYRDYMRPITRGWRDREAAHAYAEQIAAGRNSMYAREYARKIDEGKSKTYSHAYVRQIYIYFYYVGGRVNSARVGAVEYAHAFANQIDAGSSWLKAHVAATASLHPLPPRIDAQVYLRNYMRQVETGKSRGYATTYAEQIARGRTEDHAHAYTVQIADGRDPDYAYGYATARTEKGHDTAFAEAFAQAYAQTLANAEEQIVHSEPWRYALAYSEVLAGDKLVIGWEGSGQYSEPKDFDWEAYAPLPSWEATEYPRVYARQTETHFPDRYASIFAQQIMLGKSGRYASLYAEQVANGESDQFARAYIEQIIRGIPERYAYPYTKQIMDGKSGLYASIYAEQVVGGESVQFAHAYTEQVIGGMPQKKAHPYAKQIARGMSDTYAIIYAEQIASGKTEIYAHTYTEQVVGGNWRLYARIYARAVDLGRRSQRAFSNAYPWLFSANEPEHAP